MLCFPTIRASLYQTGFLFGRYSSANRCMNSLRRHHVGLQLRIRGGKPTRGALLLRRPRHVSFGTSCGSCSWGCLRGGNTPVPRRCRISSWLGMFSLCRAVRADGDNIKCYMTSAVETMSLFCETVSLTNLHFHHHPGCELLGDDDGVALSAGQSQAVSSVSGYILQRDHSHPNQVAAVDPLIALCYNGLNTLKTQTKNSFFTIRHSSETTHHMTKVPRLHRMMTTQLSLLAVEMPAFNQI